MKPRSLVGWLEFSLISLGMPVCAYLLEKMILRSVKSGGPKHRDKTSAMKRRQWEVKTSATL
ncbi:MAG: hypothetical protein OEU99_17675 [Nitrospira sp.]|nr:hypothetical protein [Nitrospira sp.]